MKKIRTSSDAAGDERPRPSEEHLREYAVFPAFYFDNQYWIGYSRSA
jgi:hypothetical protein